MNPSINTDTRFVEPNRIARVLVVRDGRVEPLIIVGLYNTGVRRVSEYTPTRDRRTRKGGKAERYALMLAREIKPFIDHTYRTRKSVNDAGVGGSSLGALIALYTAVARPGMIGRLLLESPSLWASGRQLVKESRSVRIWPERMFLAVGSSEAGSAERSRTVVDDVRELAAIMRRAVLSESRLRLVVKDGAGHNEAAWAERFPEALRFLFGS